MANLISGYYNWLHGKWPDGKVEPLPKIDEEGETNRKNIFVVGDLTGIPLLKFSAHSGAKAVRTIAKRIAANSSSASTSRSSIPIAIIGGGVSGYAAAMEAKKLGIDYVLIEAQRSFSTIENFPNEKPIFTYPVSMIPHSELSIDNTMDTKENLLAALKAEVTSAGITTVFSRVEKLEHGKDNITIALDDGKKLYADHVVVAIGKSGDFRTLGVKGEELSKVVNRLHDPKLYKDKNLLVVGGGNTACEAAIACANAGANVTFSYRGSTLNRPNAENVDALNELAKANQLTLELQSTVEEITPHDVKLKTASNEIKTLTNDAVLSLIGREAPLQFFRKSNIEIKGESTLKGWFLFAFFIIAVIAVYDWKNFGFFNSVWSQSTFPSSMPQVLSNLGDSWDDAVNDRSTLLGTVATSMKSRSFYYTLVYTSLIGIFGWMRIRRRKTPYVKIQTYSLFFIQAIPLFILPEIILPLLGYNGFFDSGWLKSVADSLFPSYISAEELALQQWPSWGHPRAYWHAYGFILAWPLNVYNVFTPTPIVGWLIISAIQTFIIIPALIYKFGKGAYCGWICSCGALAETVGDTQREKMPHGPFWNKLNMIGQVLLAVAFILLIVRILGWVFPESWMANSFNLLLKGENNDYQLVNPVSWKWTVDVLLGGILGVGLYFKYSGRVWCRFACPLAALMHIYARFSQFRIFSKKEKCISCNMCTSVCHQGIDVMSFANKGEPMQDPQCVRCSACVQTCPTQVLSFGTIDTKTGQMIKTDSIIATSSGAQFIDVAPSGSK